ncbi:DUF4831 family protein [Carboxylicivirga linearis]|uniref:DUF4831 family protein n=1 Tax=Carboxylicivirga linearis TaxID=1628157 RepID=A0ABS5JQY6_9BACT|nr:DUF4831 family protein [Carboxylicivirga linearis]MBS2097281.1 DUF4831 family protein [Carboxylicivirga linearis]
MKKFLFVLSTVALLASCAGEKTIPSKVNVKAVSSMQNATTNNIIYSLPTTHLKVAVTVEKTIFKVGPFYRYSQKMLNVTDVVTEDKVEWKIKDVDISSYGLPDPSKQFAISYEGNNVAPLINLTGDGVLYGINSDVVIEQSSALKKYDYIPLPDVDDVNFNDVAMLGKQLEKTSTAAMAQEAANFIYKLRKRRFKILASDFEQLPPDGQAYEVMIQELNDLEQSFLELFVGKKVNVTETKIFDLEPSSLSAESDVLFRFSSVKGIVDKMDVSGAPVYIEIKAEEQPKIPDAPLPPSKDEVRNGLFYCKPGKVIVKLIDRNQLIKEQEVYLGQYGQLISLPSTILEEERVSIQLDEKTGALQSIKRSAKL